MDRNNAKNYIFLRFYLGPCHYQQGAWRGIRGRTKGSTVTYFSTACGFERSGCDPGTWKSYLKWLEKGSGGFISPTNPDIADIFGRMEFYSAIFVFKYYSGFQFPRFLDFWVTATATMDELSDPNLTPLPTHPGIKYVARSPCCDIMMVFPVTLLET